MRAKILSLDFLI